MVSSFGEGKADQIYHIFPAQLRLRAKSQATESRREGSTIRMQSEFLIKSSGDIHPTAKARQTSDTASSLLI